MKNKKTYVGLLLALAMFNPVYVQSQGLLITQHSGANNPTNEGFTFSSHPALIGAVLNDQGVDAWSIQATNEAPVYYSYFLSPIQQSEIMNADWSLSVTLRLISANSIGVILGAGTEGGFFLNFGINSNGDPTVQAGNSGPVFVLTNAGFTYNNYQLVYDATANAASLWVNGVQKLDNITGDLGYGGSWSVFWGKFQSPPLGSSQANWNLVSLEIVPEPPVFSLICLGSGVLVYVIRRKQR